MSLACAEENAQLDAKPAAAPVFSKDETTVSVFGLFRDGRLSPDSWEKLGPALSAPFGKALCDSAYTAHLENADPALSSVIDDYAKENGITDELLDQFASLAEGKVILAFTVLGHVPAAKTESSAGASNSAKAQSQTPGSGGQGMAGGGTGMGGGGLGRGGMGRGMGGGRHFQTAPSTGNQTQRADRGEFQFSASFFSVRLHRSIATESLTYSGSDIDEALKKFADRLGTVLPGSTCKGWNWQVQIDSGHIREMIDQSQERSLTGFLSLANCSSAEPDCRR